MEQDTEQPERKSDKDRLREVHERALRRFRETADPQLEIRAQALEARRFCDIKGAQWEGEWGEQFENGVKVEVNKVQRSIRKIENDYRQNRVVPDFRPASDISNQDTADTLDGLHRADSYHFKAGQARDNAFSEGIRGGFGAWRLANDLADPYDKDSDEQRINPGLIIVDADQRVFFDANSKLYDKSDARFAFVLTAVTRDAFEEEWPDSAADWPETVLHRPQWPLFMPDVVVQCEYYEVEERREKLFILTHNVSGEERREWASDMDVDELADLEAAGWVQRSRMQLRRRVHKYLMTGADVLEDQGFVAGCHIPVVPFYGNRSFVDGVEVFTGHVQSKMDPQRLYNGQVSKLAETDALAPREVPIFLREQMGSGLAEMWARQNIDRHPYALVDPVIDPVTGQYVAMGPIGKIEPPQLSPVKAALLQISNTDLTEDDDDGADEVKANVSAEAMDIAATRVDAKSGIYLDNFRQSVQREGEIYLSMAGDVYFEPGRTVETMDADGNDGTAKLKELFTDAAGRTAVRNDFGRGRYKVIADVTEATSTRRDKTVKSMLNTASIATTAGDADLARIAILTAVMNQDGEGLSDMQAYARKQLVQLGVVEPNEEEAQAMAEAAQNAEPDAAALALQAQAKELETRAAKNIAQTEEIGASADLKQAQTVKTLADAGKARAETAGARVDAHMKLNPPANDEPIIRRGRDLQYGS